MSEEAVDVLAFTDGAAKGNPGPGGWGAVLLLAGASVRELGGSGGNTTNNRMELVAAAAALEWVAQSADAAHARITVATDSTYVLRGITEWLSGWKRRDWKTKEGADIANRDLWERLAAAAAACPRTTWRLVPGHSGVAGNVRADEIASGFATGQSVRLFSGPVADYGRDVTLPDAMPPRIARAGAAAKKTPAHSYLSLVDGVVRRHSTWTDCEQRVKGRSGAKWRKAASASEESSILADWGAGEPQS
jgi:ribonuclease HI